MQEYDINALFEQYGAVEELEIDEGFAEHMSEEARQYEKHKVSFKEVRQMHAGSPEYFLNEGVERRAPVIIVGPTNTGRMIVVPIEPTRKKGVWHPITAFEANAHHKERYEERRRYE